MRDPSPDVTDEDERPDHETAPRAFFGRRKGHPLRAGQASLMQGLLPRLALDLARPAPADLRGLFDVPVSAVHLEIGFGGGEHLVAQAQASPDTGFIGCEPFVNGMAKALAAIEQHGLANVRLHFGDAIALLPWLPAASLERAYLLYPDPWPKRRHWKRRFVQAERLAALARVLRPGGAFRFATDIEDYAAWTLSLTGAAAEFSWTAERADDWRLPWPGYVRTRYEAKAVREGRDSAYLEFRRI
ncbi:MAG: tRNA (guanosine(46)-N7)-methyltransferase TrmB [Rhizobiales bacterium]|nr:tRNA (guanosine(46)-N7)-methyltransferase TrmB [Hyphomicrobiales bacterium]